MTTTEERLTKTAPGCSCAFAANHPTEHDLMLGIEDMNPIVALTYLAAAISDDDLGPLIEWRDDDHGSIDVFMLQSDPQEFRRFVAQHNWKNPVAMADLAEYATELANQAWSGRQANRSGRRPAS